MRLAFDNDEVCWVLDDQQLSCVQGQPLPQPYFKSADEFEPCDDNPDALRVVDQWDLPAGWQPLGLTTTTDWVCVLAHRADDSQGLLLLDRTDTAGFTELSLEVSPENFQGNVSPWFIDIGALDDNKVALLANWSPDDRDAIAVQLYRIE